MITSGQLRGLAVSSRKRSTELRELPSISELYPNYEATIWQGLFGPAGLPQDIVDKLRKEVSAILESQDFADKLAKAGSGEPYITSLDEFKARIHRDFERMVRSSRPPACRCSERTISGSKDRFRRATLAALLMSKLPCKWWPSEPHASFSRTHSPTG